MLTELMVNIGDYDVGYKGAYNGYSVDCHYKHYKHFDEALE